MERADRQLYQSRRIRLLPVDKIAPNPRQPRRRFEEQPLRELADSIRQHGVLQPLTVQRTPEGYVLVAGERRLRAAAMAGLTHVPCILVRVSEEDSAVLALIDSTTSFVDYDQNVLDIISDEAAGYFAGSKTVEEASKLIQSRVSLYIQEQK